MERDFMGLSSKETLPLLKNKEEINNNNDACKDSGFMKGSVVKWPFLNKVSAHPHFMSFSVCQKDKAKTMATDSITSAGFFAVPNLDAFDSTQKRVPGEVQKSLNLNGQGGIHFSLTPYPVQHDVNSVNPPDVKMFSASNQAISVNMEHDFLKNHFGTVGQNMNGANAKQPLLGVTPVTAPHSVLPVIGTIAGMTESCVKPTIPAPKLTIFYAGTVNVFDDISPEKAQAIMLLAGDGKSAASNVVQLKVQASNFVTGDGVTVSQHINAPPCSRLSSPLSVSSLTGAHSGSGSSSSEEFLAAKQSTPKVVNAPTMLPSAVPQARKASLARFLEKRKERVMNAAPYNLNNNKKYEINSLVPEMSTTIGTSTLSAKQG